jgi:molybdenum cofactor cytidylyltransferase
MNPVGILLAAGRGRRFDPLGERNKLLVRLGERSIVAASAELLLSTMPRVVAVVAPSDGGVADLLRGLGCEVVVCPDADTGMAASLVCALRHTQDADGWIVGLGDMPHILPSTVHALAAALAAGDDIAAPVYQGRRGNPVAFSRLHLPALLALTGDEGARSIVRANPVREVAVNDPGVLLDIFRLSFLLKYGTL